MQLLAFGLNHDTAPLDLRERAAFSAEAMPGALTELTRTAVAREATILSTCNRTEIYCGNADLDQFKLLHWFADYSGFNVDELASSTYLHTNESAVKHAFRVASGLDSMVLGEPQILGQMKAAYRQANEAGTTGKVFNRLFQHTFSVAKQIRTDTSIGENPVSVAYAGVNLATRVFTDLAQQTALLIGAGETIELVARHLKQQRVRHIIIANRSIERAESLAGEIGCEAITLADIQDRLHEADILVSSTASTLPILGKGAVEAAIRKRRRRPMFLLDLAVPRDVESAVTEIPDVYLYTVDDLKHVVEQNIGMREQAAREAESIIDLQVVRFMRWIRSLESEALICSFRQQVNSIKDAELDKARQRIARGTDPDQALEQLARDLTNKFAHHPSQQLKASDPDNTGLISAARKLFGL